MGPKVSVPVGPKWHVGGGLLYAHVPRLEELTEAFDAGIGYGVATYGTADNNLSAGIGYGTNPTGLDPTPLLSVGGQKRISRSWSLVSENFLLMADDEPGVFGLFGARYAVRRFGVGLGAIYVVPFAGPEEPIFGLPVYFDLAFRFGKGSRQLTPNKIARSN